MRASVVESLHAFFLARAPVVAFTLSLIAMAFSLFLVAFYIKDNDLLLNLHAQEVRYQIFTSSPILILLVSCSDVI